ncbi:hypothetical protein M0R45_024025 [Rubus argutus]|uniref:Uncharacterized protein n=1 Tax=Rubus argutus TaxID=59490 RepID=A0AAW1WPP5_RUBAR
MSSRTKRVPQVSQGSCIFARGSTEKSMILGKSSRSTMPGFTNEEDDAQIFEDTNRKYLGRIRAEAIRKALQIEEKEDESIVSVAQGLPRNQQQQEGEAIYVAQGLPAANPQVAHGLFYGNYSPPNLPPVPSLRQLIEICSEPFEKQLTNSDVKDDQSRLAMSKEDVEKRLIPLLNENEDLSLGIPAGWKTFRHDHNLVENQDFVTVWMFRNAATGNLCFVIQTRRLQVFETIKRRRKLR